MTNEDCPPVCEGCAPTQFWYCAKEKGDCEGEGTCQKTPPSFMQAGSNLDCAGSCPCEATGGP